MSKVLVIPDIHLKINMLDDARKILESEQFDGCVFLGDLVDDWGKQEDDKLYRATYEAALKFFTDFPEAKFCIGNHDISYVWEKLESGFSHKCIDICQYYMKALQNTLGDRMAFVHRIGNVLFSHGGVTEYFVRVNIGLKKTDEEILNYLNMLPLMERGKIAYWNNISPIWYRPYDDFAMWRPRKFLQITGHTPVKKAYQDKSLVICDTFSTYQNGDPIGNEKFLVVDCESKEWWEY